MPLQQEKRKTYLGSQEEQKENENRNLYTYINGCNWTNLIQR